MSAMVLRCHRFAALFLAVALAAAAGTVAAHPHVWIDSTATFRFDSQHRIVAITTTWLFDDMFSTMEADAWDADRDGRTTIDELRPLAEVNVEQLADWDYFSLLKVGDERVALGPITDHEMVYEQGRLRFTLTLTLAKPVDPRAAPIRFAVFDPTFYVEILPAERNPVRFEGAPDGCVARIERALSDEPAYVPDSVVESAAIDPRDPETSIGAEFAAWIVLTCAGSS